MPIHEPEVISAKLRDEHPETLEMNNAILSLRVALSKRLNKKVVAEEVFETTLACLFAYLYGRDFTSVENFVAVYELIDRRFHQLHEGVGNITFERIVK